MPFNVTSWFIEQTMLKTSEPVRKFVIGNSDYSDYVLKWPKFKKQWDDIRPLNFTINLANEDQLFNFFIDNKTKLKNAVKLQMGYTHPTSGDELITLFAGETDYVKYGRGDCGISITDKFKQLSERIVGTSDEAVNYTESNYLPSDIAWWLVTSYGGYDITTDSSNTDIDYDSFSQWASIFSESSIFVKATFDGQKVTDALRKLARMTRSAIYIEEDKVSFKRFSLADSNTVALTDDNIKNLSLSINDADSINKQYVFADYDITSDFHKITVWDASTAHVNSFGLHEDTEEDNNIWYVNTVSALDLAQRVVNTKKEPFDSLGIDTVLEALPYLIGETVTVVDSAHGLTGKGFRIMGKDIDMERGLVKLQVDRSQFGSPFILDTSSLNGSDQLT